MTEHGATPEEVTQAQSDLAKVWEQGTTAGYRACEEMGAIDEHSCDNGHGVSRRCRSGSNGRAIGGATNVSTQLTVNGDKPFSYTDALLAIGTGHYRKVKARC